MLEWSLVTVLSTSTNDPSSDQKTSYPHTSSDMSNDTSYFNAKIPPETTYGQSFRCFVEDILLMDGLWD